MVTEVNPGQSLQPGVDKPHRFRPRLAYELLGCGLHGHELVGTDAAIVDAADALVAREFDGLRWYRCLRCDSWLPMPPPQQPARQRIPPRAEIAVPLRGRPLRDRFVLRAIAVDRILHFVLAGALAAGILLFAHDRERLRGSWTRILNRLQGATGGPLTDTHRGVLHDLDRLFTVSSGKLLLYGTVIGLYALINLLEAFGLWWAKRWAEYLTFIEVIALVPVEIHELTVRVSPLKVLTLLINLAVVGYLLFAHRLFGVRGGGKADKAERDRDTGWDAIERAGLSPIDQTGTPPRSR